MPKGIPLGPRKPRQQRPVEGRFWSKVEVTGFCWLWTGRKHTTGGYGSFQYEGRRGGKRTPAHRFAYESLIGPIPKGLTIDHLCRVPACVNPDHLEPVTQRENTLRGFGTGACYARRSCCGNGHEFTSENTIIRSGGARRCRACKRENATGERARKRARLMEAATH